MLNPVDNRTTLDVFFIGFGTPYELEEYTE